MLQPPSPYMYAHQNRVLSVDGRTTDDVRAPQPRNRQRIGIGAGQEEHLQPIGMQDCGFTPRPKGIRHLIRRIPARNHHPDHGPDASCWNTVVPRLRDGTTRHGMGRRAAQIHESKERRPIDQFIDTINRVISFIRMEVNDQGNVTVHLWLSLQLLLDHKPPHNVMLENSFMNQFVKGVTDLDQIASRPVIVAINNDSMFNCMDSVTSRIAVVMTERLKSQGVMVTSDQRMWRSMYSQFGGQLKILSTTRRGSLGKTAIWSVIEKNLFRQRVFLMCATNREFVSTLNEGAFKPKESGIDPDLLTTGPTQVFRIASGEMTPDDYAKADAKILQKSPPPGTTTTRFTKDKRYKTQWIEPMLNVQELEPETTYNCYWFPVFPDSVDLLCEKCRSAESMDAIEFNQHRPTTCINCSANTQDHCQGSAPTLGARRSVLVLAARLKVAFENCGVTVLDISKGFQPWLVLAPSSVIANKHPKYGEQLMKSLSHMGGVRVPPNQVKEIFKNGRGKQFSVYRERIWDRLAKKWILAFRVTKDCGNVAYKDFFEQVAVPEIKDRNDIFAFSRATAEKVGDIIEFWLGILDVASMARGLVDVFETQIDPAEYLNGLEKALKAFGSTARTSSTVQ